MKYLGTRNEHIDEYPEWVQPTGRMMLMWRARK